MRRGRDVALLLQLVVAIQLADLSQCGFCAPGMTQVVIDAASTTWCVQWYSSSKTFCDAVKTCHQNGQEIIGKDVLDAMKAASFAAQSNSWWVGLVDALNERGSNKSGWVWMKDGRVTSGDPSYFDVKEPNDLYKQDCVTTVQSQKLLLRDATCSDQYPFYCYSDPTTAARASSKPHRGKFELVQISDYTQPDPGCWIKRMTADALDSCTLACLQLDFYDCVGFFWHPTRRQCALLPYFDASLPLDTAEFSANPTEAKQWVKYLRAEW